MPRDSWLPWCLVFSTDFLFKPRLVSYDAELGDLLKYMIITSKEPLMETDNYI